MPRSVLTTADLEGVPAGQEVVIAADTLVTPLAREEAERRRITLRIAEEAPAKGQRDGRRVVALGADHGGYELKEQLKAYLRDWGYVVLDLG
ncbi:MAG TPA: hypothetical protein VHM88_21290, partial [Candidatus Acidoferrales bacterium]|nr:hypothetical protein [Candidatus Acidoferrales bacterium]